MGQKNAIKAIWVFCFMFAFSTFIAPQTSWALEVLSAKLEDGIVKITGKDAAPNAFLYWEGEDVGEAKDNGTFSFSSDWSHAHCTGFLEDGYDEVYVPIENCLKPVLSFYDVANINVTVKPENRGSVRIYCNLGDFVVAPNIVIRPDGYLGVIYDFRITQSSIIIDGTTGLQSWYLSGFNAGNVDVDVRLAVRCATRTSTDLFIVP